MLLRSPLGPWLPGTIGLLVAIGAIHVEPSPEWQVGASAGAGALLALSAALAVYRQQRKDAHEQRIFALTTDLQQTLFSLRKTNTDPLVLEFPDKKKVELRVHLFETVGMRVAAENGDLTDDAYRRLLALLGEIAVYNRRVNLLLDSFDAKAVFEPGEEEVYHDNLQSWFIGPLIALQNKIDGLIEGLLMTLGANIDPPDEGA